MKKMTKRLLLKKETVRELQAAQLARAPGGTLVKLNYDYTLKYDYDLKYVVTTSQSTSTDPSLLNAC
jgi:predicted amino acid dehydrogenase